jgi:hypothetical protein
LGQSGSRSGPPGGYGLRSPGRGCPHPGQDLLISATRVEALSLLDLVLVVDVPCCHVLKSTILLNGRIEYA